MMSLISLNVSIRFQGCLNLSEILYHTFAKLVSFLRQHFLTPALPRPTAVSLQEGFEATYMVHYDTRSALEYTIKMKLRQQHSTPLFISRFGSRERG